MSAALPKLMMTVRSAHLGSSLTRVLSRSRGTVARSTQMCSLESILSALTAIFNDIRCPRFFKKSMVKRSSLISLIRPKPHVLWYT